MSRYIDADILVQDAIQEYARSKQYRDAIIRMVNKAPTIEPKRGEWIRISSLYSLDRTYKCSVCGKVIDDMPMDEYYDPAYKGCPYCLASMERSMR